MGRKRNSRLTPPRLQEKGLVREQLLSKIEAGFAKKIMVLEAGAGHGKTVTLRASLEKVPKHTWRWINLSEDSNQYLSFWSFILDSLEEFMKEDKEAVFEYFDLSSKNKNMDEFIYLLANVLYGEEIYLVLEDFHNIENKDILDSILLFMKSVSPSFHLILTTRVKPSIYLGEFLMDDQLHYICEEDFIIDDKSAKEFISLSSYHEIDATTQDKMIKKAGGWIGGLQLILISKDYSDQVSSQKKVMHDYLVKEIISKLAESELNFLVQTAYYPFVFEELTTALFPNLSHHDMLNKLLDRNLMLTLFEGEGSRFSYHPLIRESLIEEFLKCSPSEINIQKRKAAEAFIDSDYFEEGIELLFELKDDMKIMELIVEQHPQSLRTSYYINKISDASAILNPDFAIQKILHYYTLQEYEHGACLIDSLELSNQQIKDSRLLEAFRMTIFGNVRSAENFAVSEVEMEELNLSDGSKSLICLVNAIFLFYNKSIFDSIQSVKKSMSYNQKQRNPFMSYCTKSFLAQIYEEIGDVNVALELLEETNITLKSWDMDDHMLLNYTANFNLTIAGIYLKKMDLAQAKKSLEIASYYTYSHPHASYLYNEIERLYLEQDSTTAYIVMEELNSLGYYKDFKNKSYLLRYQLKNNQLSTRKQQEYLQEYDTLDHLLLRDQIFYGMLLLSQNRRVEAKKIAEDVLELSRKDKVFSKIINASLLKIDCMLVDEKFEKRILIDTYHEAIYYGKEHGLLSDFILYREVLLQLYNLSQLDLTDDFDIEELAFHEKVIQLIGYHKESQLSKREIEVLIELSQGYKNKEISEHLFISLATTKTHILNIYRKLEVNSRVMAIDEAKRLGLLQ